MRHVSYTDENGNYHSGELLCVHNVMTVEVPTCDWNRNESDGTLVRSQDAAAYVIVYGKVKVIPAHWLVFI